MFYYENKKSKLAPLNVYYKRLLNTFLVALLLLSICLGIGIAGYMLVVHLGFYDALYNASMILSGMGPLDIPGITNSGKVFASAYALFSGVAFISIFGLLVTPVAHRFFHKLHVEDDDDK